MLTLFKRFCPASAFVSADRDEARNPQRFIHVTVVSITIFSAISLRNYTISKMSTYYGNDYLAVSVTYISPQITQKAIDIIIKDINAQNEISKLFGKGDKKIFYVMPQSWIFPELGMVGELDDHNNPERRSASHGNPKDTEPTKKRVLVSKAILIRETKPSEILYVYSIKQQIPQLYVDIDLEKGTVISISKPPIEGMYSDITVPVF